MTKCARSWPVIGGRTSRLAAAAAAALAVAGCVSEARQPPAVIDTGCFVYSPIRPTMEDIQVISPGLARAILEHNRKYRRLCQEKAEGAP